MVVTLYGNTLSTATQRVAIVLHEKNVPFMFSSIDFATAQHKSPEYMAKQPFGQLPVLDVNGYLIYESRAIARYIAEKYADQGTPLIPKDMEVKGLFEQAASVEQSNFEAYAAPAIYENVFMPMYGATPDKKRADELLAKLQKTLDVYENILSKQKYIAGDELTLVDLFHIPCGALLPAAGSNAIATRPHVARWFKDITDRPSWQALKNGISGTASNL